MKLFSKILAVYLINFDTSQFHRRENYMGIGTVLGSCLETCLLVKNLLPKNKQVLRHYPNTVPHTLW